MRPSLEDYDWVRRRILEEVHFLRGSIGAYEDHLFRLMVEEEGKDRESWQARTRGQRATVVSDVIHSLVVVNEIYAVRTENQGTGRRCFRITNVLDRIVAQL